MPSLLFPFPIMYLGQNVEMSIPGQGGFKPVKVVIITDLGKTKICVKY